MIEKSAEPSLGAPSADRSLPSSNDMSIGCDSSTGCVRCDGSDPFCKPGPVPDVGSVVAWDRTGALPASSYVLTQPAAEAPCTGVVKQDRRVVDNLSSDHHLVGAQHGECMINNPAFDTVIEACDDPIPCKEGGHGSRHTFRFAVSCDPNPFYNPANPAFGPRCVPNIQREPPEVDVQRGAELHKHRCTFCDASCALAPNQDGRLEAVSSCKLTPNSDTSMQVVSYYPIPGPGGVPRANLATQYRIAAAGGYGAVHDMDGTNAALGVGVNAGPVGAFAIEVSPGASMFYKVRGYSFVVACDPETGEPLILGRIDCEEKASGDSPDGPLAFCD
jgi:hypothetical protein